MSAVADPRIARRSKPPRAGQLLGRFALKRELGRGAQATVWLAHDPLLQREVALKVLEPAEDSASEQDHWLHEARAVSALSHPNVVPVFEAVDAGADGERPYLVFEFVDGPTLAQKQRARGAWPAGEAVTLMLGVLDALAAAHALGLVHRDLKPSNVLLGQDGRARVMDFGIAAPVPAAKGSRLAVPGGAGAIVGSPGYISPEAARGEAPAPCMDVFAAGVMLAELLSGEPLLKEHDPWRALERVQKEDLALPESVRVDDALRGIVMRALARDARRRYEGARALHTALAAWLQPDAAAANPPDESHATLGFLLRRMRHKTDFPALTESVLRIQRMATSETARLTHLADEVLTDVALTSKLLRMVNSVHFASMGSGQITTVSRAVALVGFAGIRNMAMAVLLLEHMQDKAHATQLRQEFLHALTAGALASELEPRAREGEEAFLGSMLQNLGRLLVEYYFPEEAIRIRALVAARASSPLEGDAAREAAAVHVLGLTLDDLGCGVARAWGLPEGLQQVMRHPVGAIPSRALTDRTERLRWLANAANAMADAVMRLTAEELDAGIEGVVGRYGPALGISLQAARRATGAARERVATLTQALGIKVPRQGAAQRLLAMPRSAKAPLPPPSRPDSPAPAPDAQVPMQPAESSPSALVLDQGRSRIEQGVRDRSLRLNEVLHLALATLQQALLFRAVVLCLRDGQTGRLIGRVSLGPLAARSFQIGPATKGDLLSVVSHRAVDTLIEDARTVAARMPAWWRQQVQAGTFLLLPLAMNGVTVGLIYADKAEPGSLLPSPADLAAVRSLRDAVVSAFATGLR